MPRCGSGVLPQGRLRRLTVLLPDGPIPNRLSYIQTFPDINSWVGWWCTLAASSGCAQCEETVAR